MNVGQNITVAVDVPQTLYFLQEVSQNLIKSVVSSCENALNVRLQ